MNPEKVRIDIIEANCIGIATCATVLSQVFSIGDDGRVKLNNGNHLSDYPGVTLESLMEAAQVCPTIAIAIIDEDTNTPLFPK